MLHYITLIKIENSFFFKNKIENTLKYIYTLFNLQDLYYTILYKIIITHFRMHCMSGLNHFGVSQNGN